MNICRYGSVSIRPILAASLCSIALVACEPNSSSAPQPAPVTTPAAATSAIVEQPQATPTLQELDAAARKAKLVQAHLCNIEMIDGAKPTQEAVVPKDSASVALSGWVGDDRTGTRPDDARLRFESMDRQHSWEWSVGAPVIRKDVAKHVNTPGLEDSGFVTKVDLSALPQGEYRIYLVYGDPGDAYLCDNGRHLMR